MTATMTAWPGTSSVPAGKGSCGRAGCGRPLPAGERGRSRRFCSDECRRRHYNALRSRPAPAAPLPETIPGTALGKLAQLLAEASQLAVTASAQLAESDPGRVAAVLAGAEAARCSADARAATARDAAIRERDTAVSDAHRAAARLAAARQQAEREASTVQAACRAREEASRELAAAATARAERAEEALDAEHAERRALIGRLTAIPPRPRPGNRPATPPGKDKQPREARQPPAA